MIPARPRRAALAACCKRCASRRQLRAPGMACCLLPPSPTQPPAPSSALCSGVASASSGQWRQWRSSLAGSALHSTSSIFSAPPTAKAGCPDRCSTSARAPRSSRSWRGPSGCRAAHHMRCSWRCMPTRTATAASGRVGGAALACCAGIGWAPPSRSFWAVSGVTRWSPSPTVSHQVTTGPSGLRRAAGR